MKNPYHGKPLSSALPTPTATPKGTKAVIKPELVKIGKQIDRVRKQIKRLEEKAPYSPALARAKQFEKAHGITSLGQTAWIKTPAQLKEYREFLKTFEKYETRTVRGARAAQKKQLSSLASIMQQSGWDPARYSVDDFYNQLNKIDVYGLMNDFGVSSEKVVEATTHLMNTNASRRVTANKILTNIFGSPVTTPQGASSYNKGTQAYSRRKKKR